LGGSFIAVIFRPTLCKTRSHRRMKRNRNHRAAWQLCLGNNPKFYFLLKSNLCALRAGHLNMVIGEYIPAGGLVSDQVMRLNNLNPAAIGSSVFWIIPNEGGDVHELKHQIVRSFERSERINRDD
jgi:hypothetical protein